MTSGSGTADASDEFIVLASDSSRELNSLPAHHTEMQISCGLYWRLLQRALAAQGWVVRSIATSAEADLTGLGLAADWRPLRLIRFQRAPEQTEHLCTLRSLAEIRHTDRGPYLDKSIPPATLDALARLGVRDDHRIHVRFLISEQDRNQFVRFVARHAGRDFTYPEAWRETHSFIRGTDVEARERGDGFTLTHLFGPLSRKQRQLRRIVLAPTTMRLFAVTGLPRILAGRLATVVRRSAAVAALSLPCSDAADDGWIAAGEMLADFWLHATDAGLVLHPISVVVQHEDLRERLQSEFMLSGQAFFIARLGYSTQQFPPSPRRDPAASLREL
ncbi:hypothetical protein ACIO14_07695 [Nocardia fluminea]|uniref:hypothetical protein n=1 Tax=Nocardia fluminea TaxID=134984 RepID=UPI0038203B3B